MLERAHTAGALAGPAAAVAGRPADGRRVGLRQVMRGVRTAAAAAALAGVAAVAHAGLFDDDEARRAILDLRSKVEQLQQQNQKETQARQAETAETIALLKRSLLDLNNTIESLRTEINTLRGTQEQLRRELADLHAKAPAQPDLSTALAPLEDRLKPLEERLKRIEPVKVTVDGKQFMATPDERQAYEEAVAPIRNGDFASAVTALTAFQRRYPASGYSEAVAYWLGNAQYGTRDYKGAIATFRSLINAAPQHPRTPEALLAVANCQVELKDSRAAKKTLDELLKEYPKSEAAAAGKERIAMLKLK